MNVDDLNDLEAVFEGEDDIPEFGAEAYFNLTTLYADYNDVHFYVEDIDGVNLHETLLKRLVSPNIEFEYIHAVGGKDNLIKVYQESLSDKTTPCIFIADLDFDDLLEEKKVVDECFVYLSRYSIENYLVDEMAGVNFVNGRRKSGLKNCKALIDFDSWLEKTQQSYRPIIVLFALIQKMELGVKNCDHRAEYFLKNKTDQVDPIRVGVYKNVVYETVKQKKKHGIARTIQYINNRMDSLYFNEVWRLIPGKQLLGVYMKYLTNYTKDKQYNLDDFMGNAAAVCDLSELSFIKERVDFVLGQSQNNIA